MAQASPSPNSDATSVDGSVDFSGGVNSLKVTTIQSEQNPNGLARNELSWLINGSVRDGGITPRGGWKPVKKVGTGSVAYQGGFLYQPIDGSDPYLVLLIGGRPVKVSVTDQLAPQDLFTTAYQISPTDKPSITIRPNPSSGFAPGDTINVPADIQSIYGLPASFVVPAAGQSITFFTTSDVQGNVGDIILFYGAFTVQSATVTYNAGGNAWSLSLVLTNNSYPPTKVLDGLVPFGDPHGNPGFPGLTNQITGWQMGTATAPAIGANVTVNFTNPVNNHIGKGTFLMFSGSSVTGVNLGVAAGFSETITYDSVNGVFVDNIHAAFLEPGGISVGGNLVTTICGRNFDLHNGSPVPLGLFHHVDCSDTVFTIDPFVIQGVPQNLVARSPAVIPLFGQNAVSALVGTTLNYPMGTANVTNINRSTNYAFGDLVSKPFFCQGNEFLVIQAGDYVTLPLFWDGQVLRKSLGITNTAVAAGTPGVNEIPPGGPMDYYMGRLWYSTGPKADAGDITGGASGTSKYNFRDAILNVTENPLVLGGDGFQVPANEGIITALAHNASQDNALGQGILFMFTMKGAHGLTVPVTRTDWIAANNANQPKIVPVQLAMGTASDRSVVAVNGDLFYQDPLGNIRTLLTAVRYFGQWGNLPISTNIQRLIQFNDKTLLKYSCGIYFNNRMIQSALPIFTPQGAVHQAASVMDFAPISNFAANSTPIWEGMYEGLDILQMFSGVFSGKERAFAIVLSRTDFSLQLWELTADERFDNTDTRIQMRAEFPAFTWGNEFSLKQQVSAEMWIDRLYGEVVFLLEYRPDGESCWQKWHEWKVCTPRNSCESTGPNPCTGLQQVQCYPLIQFGECYKQTMTLPTPPNSCHTQSNRPSYINYQCQPRLTITGFCRVRGLLLHAVPKEKKLYDGKVC